jgi:uncharacterized protein
MWVNFARFALRYRNILTVIILLGAVFMAYKAKDVQMSYDHARLIPANDPENVAYENFVKQFGKDGTMMVAGFTSDELYNIEVFNDWYKLTERIERVNGVENVLSVSNLPQIVKDTTAKRFIIEPILKSLPKSQMQLDSLAPKIEASKLYDGLIFNSQTGATLMAISLNADLLDSKERVKSIFEIDSIIQDFGKSQGIEMHLSGLPYTRTIFAEKLKKEIVFFFVLAILVTALLLWLFFRTFSAVVIPIIIVLIAAVYSVGIIVLLGYKITVLTGLIPPLIVVIGIPNCIYLINRYHTEFRKHGNKIKALSRVIERIGVATTIANTTTAIGFGVFIFTGSSILEEFGLVTFINVLLAFFMSIILIPAVFYYLPNPGTKQTKHLDNIYIEKFVAFLVNMVDQRRKPIIATTIILVTIAAIGMTKLESISYVLDDVPKKDKLYTDLLYFQDNFKGVMPLSIIIDTHKKGGAQKLKNLKLADRLQKSLASNEFLSKPLSLVELLKAANQSYFNGKENKFTLPNSQEFNFVMPYIARSTSNTGGLTSFLTDSNNQIIRISLSMADIGTQNMERLIDEIRPKVDSIYKDSGSSITYTGKSLIFLKGNQYLIDGLLQSLVLSFLLTALAMTTLFRRGRIILLIAISNAVPLIITAGVMGFIGVSIKPATALIFSIAYGIAVDAGIYMLTRYRQEYQRHDWPHDKSILMALQETGGSVLYTAMVLCSGFIIFAASSFHSTVMLGVLTSLTLIVSMFANTLLLPSLMINFGKQKHKKIKADTK